MIAEKIKNLITRKKKNIVFCFDADGSLFSDIFEIEAAGIKVVQVEQNYFELKYKLEFDWKDQTILLYHPFAKPNAANLRDYPLLDLLVANVELKFDDASEFLADHRLPEYQLPLVKRYLKQLKTKTNQKKLAGILDPTHFNENNLKIGLIAIALNFNSITSRNSCMVKWLYLATDTEIFSKANHTLKELELDSLLLDWFNWLFNVKETELNFHLAETIASKLKYNIITAPITRSSKSDTYTSLKLERASDLNKVQAFFGDWKENPALNEYIDPVFLQLGSDIKSNLILKWYGPQQEYGYYSDEMLASIIKDYYHEVPENPVRAKDNLFKWLSSAILSKEHQNQVLFLYHTAYVFSILNSYSSFSFKKI